MVTPGTRTTKRTTAPKAKVAFDLDKLEREGERPDPFTFRHGDKVFTLADPAEIEYADIVELAQMGPEGQALMIARLLGQEQFDDLIAAGSLPQWKIAPLLVAWTNHYGVDLGEAGASRTSSNGTARR